jgi:hypothetical protein
MWTRSRSRMILPMSWSRAIDRLLYALLRFLEPLVLAKLDTGQRADQPIERSCPLSRGLCRRGWVSIGALLCVDA